MEIRVLGAIEIGNDGLREVPAPMVRRLVAALVMRLGETRPADALIDALWDGSPPASAVKLLHLYVSQLRKLLPAGASVETRSAGYSLVLDDDQAVDAVRFEHLLDEGREALRTGNAALAHSLLGKALELWRGPAYADFAYEAFALAEAEQLEELRLTALEEQIDAGLALGHHQQLLPQVLGLAADHPWRERLQGQSMLVLYRCGRQSEALELYASVRKRLRDELGLEPGPELRDRHRDILRHDPVLAAPAPVEAPGSSLPIPPTTLLGRERELTELQALLARDDVRLLVLTGAGGSGKTRLALEAAQEAASSFANGAVFVDLAPLRDPDLVVQEMARALGVQEVSGEELLETLVTKLRPQELLLFVDNAEHLREAAPVFVQLVSSAPRLTLLVTSRVVLHISGEHVYPVEPLDECSAAALFVERARDADPRFDADTDDEAILQICRRLDRLPLAILLGAGLTRTLTPTELLARLDPRLPLLTGGPEDLPSRQQTLKATLEWTLELLDEEQLDDLRSLAVFAGGCSLPAAEAVCGTTIGRLSTLVDHSLLVRATAAEGSRYSMLETVREYAADALEHTGRAEGVRERHADFFSRLGDMAEVELEGPRQAVWLRTLDEEHDNLRAALEWCFAEGDVAAGARLAASLFRYWYFRGYFAEGLRWLSRAMVASPTASPALEGKLLKVSSALAQQRGDKAAVKEMTARRLELARAHGDTREMAGCFNALGLVAVEENDLPHAEMLLTRSVSLFRKAGDDASSRIGIDIPLGNLAWTRLGGDDAEGAERFASESKAIAVARGDDEQIIAMTVVLILIRIEQERLGEAIALAREALGCADSLDSKTIHSACCTPIAVLLARQCRFERAAHLLGKRRALWDEIGRPGEWGSVRILEDAVARMRAGLGEELFLEALAAGAQADVRALFTTALEEAEAAVLAVR